MQVDRAMQRTLLEALVSAYPESFDIRALQLPEPDASANLKYLAEHGLVNLLANTGAFNMPYRVISAEATAKGLDFMADDGGLSAILGTLVVKFHADTMRDLLAERVRASTLPPADKTRLTHALQALPAEGLKHLTKRLLDAALDQWPDAILLLQKWLPL